MNFVRRSLIAGGIFNCIVGFFFLTNRSLAVFFRTALWLEDALFSRSVILPFPQNPVHLLLIHGFGAAALILGAMLIISSRDPLRYLPFIWVDGLGRLLFGVMMVFYVLRFSLLRIVLVFGVIELIFALIYIGISYKMSESSTPL